MLNINKWFPFKGSCSHLSFSAQAAETFTSLPQEERLVCAACVGNCWCVCVCVPVCVCSLGEVARQCYAHGQQLAVAAHSGHAALPALVPGVLPAASQQRRSVCPAVDLLQTAAGVALLQQPD